MEEQTNRSGFTPLPGYIEQVNKNVICGIRDINKFRALFIEILKGLVYFLHQNKHLAYPHYQKQTCWLTYRASNWYLLYCF